MVINKLFALDISFLIIILGLLAFFLMKNKERLTKEGMLYLYKTTWGINLINKVGTKYKKTLSFLSYVSIGVGYILMISILYLFGVTVFQYLTRPEIVETIRAPPIAPIIPYFPEIFGLSDFFPPLYTVYFIAAILIVATVHEFSHGIFAKRWGVKIKSTGFAFLKFFPAIFGAFVEQDDKQMNKKSKFQQMSILSAGVFANMLVGLFFFILLTLFFHIAFAPSGIAFSTYAYSVVNVSSITTVNGINMDNPNYEKILSLANDSGFNKIESKNLDYLITKDSLEKQKNNDIFLLYHDAPAIRSNLERMILKIDGVKINKIEDLRKEISNHHPGERITLTVLNEDGQSYDRDIVLGENPANKNSSWLGVAFFQDNESSFVKKELTHFISSFRTENLNFLGNTYYAPLMGGASEFIYYLIWWVVLINFLVALFNMLPVSILDGGRFFYLTILAVTGSEKFTKKVYNIFGFLIFFVFVLLMFRWLISFF